MKKILTYSIFSAFLVNCLGPAALGQAQDYNLPAPGVMVHLSPEFNPPILKGIKVHPDNPFRFDFILDKGDSKISNDALKDESSKLVRYFLASLTIPEKDMWVNLSPYEKDRIIPKSFGLTEMGRDLLAEDYMLKQITASLIYPEAKVGKEFWKKIYQAAEKRYGTTSIPVNTFNKVWIVPEKAVVYENAKAQTAYVVESKLKVMLEQDYLSLKIHEGIQSAQGQSKDINQIGSQFVREIIIPQLTKEVNEDKNFVQLRQVYNSLILATWYKKKIKDSILEQVYANKNKIIGVGYKNSMNIKSIYHSYLRAFKKGVFNYIKEENDPMTQEIVPRKYFSGGMELDFAMKSFQIIHNFDMSMVNRGQFAASLAILGISLGLAPPVHAQSQGTISTNKFSQTANSFKAANPNESIIFKYFNGQIDPSPYLEKLDQTNEQFIHNGIPMNMFGSYTHILEKYIAENDPKTLQELVIKANQGNLYAAWLLTGTRSFQAANIDPRKIISSIPSASKQKGAMALNLLVAMANLGNESAILFLNQLNLGTLGISSYDKNTLMGLIDFGPPGILVQIIDSADKDSLENLRGLPKPYLNSYIDDSILHLIERYKKTDQKDIREKLGGILFDLRESGHPGITDFINERFRQGDVILANVAIAKAHLVSNGYGNPADFTEGLIKYFPVEGLNDDYEDLDLLIKLAPYKPLAGEKLKGVLVSTVSKNNPFNIDEIYRHLLGILNDTDSDHERRYLKDFIIKHTEQSILNTLAQQHPDYLAWLLTDDQIQQIIKDYPNGNMDTLMHLSQSQDFENPLLKGFFGHLKPDPLFDLKRFDILKRLIKWGNEDVIKGTIDRLQSNDERSLELLDMIIDFKDMSKIKDQLLALNLDGLTLIEGNDDVLQKLSEIGHIQAQEILRSKEEKILKNVFESKEFKQQAKDAKVFIDELRKEGMPSFVQHLESLNPVDANEFFKNFILAVLYYLQNDTHLFNNYDDFMKVIEKVKTGASINYYPSESQADSSFSFNLSAILSFSDIDFLIASIAHETTHHWKGVGELLADIMVAPHFIKGSYLDYYTKKNLFRSDLFKARGQYQRSLDVIDDGGDEHDQARAIVTVFLLKAQENEIDGDAILRNFIKIKPQIAALLGSSRNINDFFIHILYVNLFNQPLTAAPRFPANVKGTVAQIEYLLKKYKSKPTVVLSTSNGIVEAMKAKNGGIDLTSANMNLQIKNNRGEIKFHLDPIMFCRLQDTPGFVVNSITIQTLENLFFFLGITQSQTVN